MNRELVRWRPTLVDALASPDLVAEWAVVTEPGPDVAQWLALINPGELSAAGQLNAVLGWERVTAWVAARQQRLLAACAGDATPRPADRNWIREEVACALSISLGTAGQRLALARELSRLPRTVELLDVAAISPAHARVLAQAVLVLDDAGASAVEQRVLVRAPEQDVALFTRSVRRAVLAADPASAQQRRNRALADRCVSIRPQPDGMAGLWGVLPAEGAAAVDTLLHALADRARREQPDDGRTHEQRRADALVDLAASGLTRRPGVEPMREGAPPIEDGPASDAGQALDRHGLPMWQGIRPRVQVTVALSTLLALDEQPGELDGYGPIPAPVARRIAADPSGTWRRLITDERGRLLDYGRTTYRPPQDLIDFVIARDSVCRFPGCNTAARRCHLDHVVAYSAGGTTNTGNLQALHQRHHIAKHEAGWKVSGDANDELIWTSPAGRGYRSPPAEHPIDQTVDVPEPDGTAATNHAVLQAVGAVTGGPDPPPF
jgi:hypothetical protein